MGFGLGSDLAQLRARLGIETQHVLDLSRALPSDRPRQTLGAKTAVILYVNDSYGVTLKDAFQEFFTAGGGKVVSQEAYETKDTDFRTPLTRVKDLKPDVVFFPGYYKEPALILKQAADLGLVEAGVKFLGTDGSCTDDLIKIAERAAEGAYFANLAADFDSTDPAMQAFVRGFRAKYASDPDAYATYYYDTFKMLASVLDGVNWNPKDRTQTADSIKKALYETPGYTGITGTTKFDSKGEVSKSFAIMVVRNGKFVVAK